MERLNKEDLEMRKKFNPLIAELIDLKTSPGNQAEAVIPVFSGNVFYEEAMSVGYQPDLQILEAIFYTKRDVGYLGSLCSPGSVAFVRFFIDFGSGWVDQGYTGVVQHDIPTATDCSKSEEKPLRFSASLTINPPQEPCKIHLLPRVRAILDWNQIPTAGNPDYHSIWGNTIDSYIQLKPKAKFLVDLLKFTELQKVFDIALQNPEIKLSDAAAAVPGGMVAIQKAGVFETEALGLNKLIDLYKKFPEVSAARFGLQEIKSASAVLDTVVVKEKIKLWDQYGFKWKEVLAELDNTKADTSYEELEDIGLDYNLEQFVANITIKRKAGYSGDLCTKGSYEYVSFWADWNDDCKWEYVGMTSVNVHDIEEIPAEGLTYAAILPYDFSRQRRTCSQDNVVKIRAVLSWNHYPSITDPDRLEHWGNRIDAYIQLKPGEPVGTLRPIFNILGGVSVDQINDITGLTVAGATFVLNQHSVHEGSPFGGTIVIQGPRFEGHRYRIKVTNMSNASSYYISNDFVVVGTSFVPPLAPRTTVVADPLTYYYSFQSYEVNSSNVLARWNPGTNDRLKLEMEIEGVSGVFTKFIQMDNQGPSILLQVNDGGDCTHYKSRDLITGSFYAYDKHLLSYQLSCTFDPTIVSGTSNTLPVLTPVPFSFSTAGTSTPCGKIALLATEKTIYDSQWTGNHAYTERIICLQKPQIS